MKQQYLSALLAGLATPFGMATGEEKLWSITGRVWGAEHEVAFKPGKLSLDGNFLPGESGESGADWEDESDFVYRLYKAFPVAGTYSYYFLAQAWASRRSVPGRSDVALFDSNRIAAARVVCDRHTEGKYLLFKGTISGIQKYIYNNVRAEQIGEAEKVGKRLRGRSFLVALLGEMLADRLVEELGLENANILFVGGGHFNLLLPATPEIRQKLEDVLWQINEGLLDQFELRMSVYGGFVDVTAEEFSAFGDKFKDVQRKLAEVKQRRFSNHLTNVFFYKKREVSEEKNKEEQQLETFGHHIPRAKILLEVRGTVEERKSFRRALGIRARFSIKPLSTDILLLRDSHGWKEILSALETVGHTGAPNIGIYALNNTDFLPPSELQARFLMYAVRFGFRMVGQYAPDYDTLGMESENGGLVELSDLAGLDSKGRLSLNYKQLAALRLDIDDLGALFTHGLGHPADLMRTMALSREMQLFFGGYFNRLAEAHYCYVVYAGGDDAFVLGSWINVLAFLRQLRTVFRTFTTENPEIGFSAGIYLAHPKYPIARLAKNAEEEEAIAKEQPVLFSDNSEERSVKDVVRVFGHALHWTRYEAMMKFAEQLYDNMEGRGGGIKRSVLQVLLRIIQAAHQAKVEVPASGNGTEDSSHFEFYRNLGRLHGLLSRRGYTGHDLIEQLLSDMRDFDRFQDYLLPIHYVLYKTRR